MVRGISVEGEGKWLASGQCGCHGNGIIPLSSQ